MTVQVDHTSPRPIFFHGREGRGNKGRKATWLRENYGAVTPSYDTSELAVALVTAREVLRANPPSVIIGSSFGGAVLLSLIQEGLWSGPSIFLAQAGGNFGVELRLPEALPAILIHGLNDDIVPIEASRELASSSPSDTAQLFEIDDGHRLGSIMPSGLLKLALKSLGVRPVRKTTGRSASSVQGSPVKGKLYLWGCCEGWVKFGPFEWVTLTEDRSAYLDQRGEVIMEWDQQVGGWRAPGSGMSMRTPVVTSSAKHPRPKSGGVPVKTT